MEGLVNKGFSTTDAQCSMSRQGIASVAPVLGAYGFSFLIVW